MTAIGHPDPEPPSAYLATADYAVWARRMWDRWETFMAAAAALDPPRPLSRAERWRFPHLTALASALDLQNTAIDGVNHAFTTDKALLPAWIRAAAQAASLNLSAISAEAAAALQAWPNGHHDVIYIMMATPPGPPPQFDAARLGPEDVNILVDTLGAASEWLADTACTLLMPAGDPVIGHRAEARIPQIPPNRRWHAVIVAVANNSSPPDAAMRLFDGSDPPTRAGAAAAARILGKGDASGWTAVLTRALADDDLTIRHAAGCADASTGTASCWSCPECAKINYIDTRECAFCENGGRPGEPRRALVKGQRQ